LTHDMEAHRPERSRQSATSGRRPRPWRKSTFRPRSSRAPPLLHWASCAGRIYQLPPSGSQVECNGSSLREHFLSVRIMAYSRDVFALRAADYAAAAVHARGTRAGEVVASAFACRGQIPQPLQQRQTVSERLL
jgi:hypothetical protein